MTKQRKNLPKRWELPQAETWRLEDIYPNEELWEEDWQTARAQIAPLAAYAGKLGNAAVLLECLRANDDLGQRLERLYTYAHMRRDEDNANPKYQALLDRAESLSVEAATQTAYMIPEIVALGAETIKQLLAQVPELQGYQHFLDNILRAAAHTLTPAQEELLAAVSEIAEGSRNIFTMLNNADLRFGLVRNEQGEAIELTHGNYITFMQSRKRDVRQAAFTQLYQAYSDHKNTLATAYATSVKKNLFYARSRKYPSALAAALDSENIDVRVYTNLVDTVRQKLIPLHEYLALRRRLLGVDELHMYDLHVPLVADVDWQIPFAEAKELVREALAPLGPEYIRILEQGYGDRWIDVWENEGKTSGAYAWGAYGVHPYVLLNYEENVHGLFTLAHEMGHALHTYFSNQTQPYCYSHYTIFVAEVASTVNELLLTKYLLQNTSDPGRRLYILNHFLEEFRGTVYRQTLFAEFEQEVHMQAEKGIPLTTESLSATYHDLLATYYGPGVVLDPQIKLEWARIPHFYTAFYVYKYATGFAAAIKLAQGIETEGAAAAARYLDFLRSGSANYPIPLLQAAGVDMLTPAPVAAALDYFTARLAEFAAELAPRSEIK